MQGRTGPFVLVAIVIVGCLAAGVGVSVLGRDAPSLVISVVLACAVAALLYSILGGVGEAGFELGPIKMGGSAAVLVGSAYLFNMLLEPQLTAIRENRVSEAVRAALENASFDFDRHVDPAGGWFSIGRETGAPIAVQFTDPTGRNDTREISPPRRASLRLKIGERDDRGGHLVSGEEAETGLGYVSNEQLRAVLGVSRGNLVAGKTHGPKRLHLTRGGALPADKPRTWDESCVRNLLPMQIRVERFQDSATVYTVRPCGSEKVITSSLKPGNVEVLPMMMDGRRRTFVFAVVAADHRTLPFWSSFLVIEMVSRET